MYEPTNCIEKLRKLHDIDYATERVLLDSMGRAKKGEKNGFYIVWGLDRRRSPLAELKHRFMVSVYIYSNARESSKKSVILQY